MRTAVLAVLVIAVGGGAAWLLARPEQGPAVVPEPSEGGPGAPASSRRPADLGVSFEGAPRESFYREGEALPALPPDAERPLVRIEVGHDGLASGEAVAKALASLPGFYLRWDDEAARDAFKAKRFEVPAACHEPKGSAPGATLPELLLAMHGSGFRARIQPPTIRVGKMAGPGAPYPGGAAASGPSPR